MTTAFAAPFVGVRLRHAPAVSRTASRCAMGDSIAPKIVLKDTKSDATSKVNVEWEKIAPNVSEAISVESNVALTIALRSKRNPKSLPAASTAPCPPGVAPADFYFPKKTRNLAPVINLEYNDSVSVNYNKINPVVGGVEANSVESIAFWKAPKYKYATSDVGQSQSQSEPEVLSTEAYEMYYPTKIRNRAPMINIRKPKGDWDTTASLEVGNEFVSLNTDLARQLSVSGGDDEPRLGAASTVDKYFGSLMHKAPEIVIDRETPKVQFSLSDVAEPLDAARTILSERKSE